MVTNKFITKYIYEDELGIQRYWEIGVAEVISIDEYCAAGGGDRWYYDIHFQNGTLIRDFKPVRVTFVTGDSNEH